MKRTRGILEALSEQSAPNSLVSHSGGNVILARKFFPATEAVLDSSGYLKIAVCMSGGGLVRYSPRWGRSLKLNWDRNGLLITSPSDTSEFSSPDVDMLGLAINLGAHDSLVGNSFPLASLEDRPLQVSEDDVIHRVIVAMWTCAEFHGTKGAFIDEGVNIILERLLQDRHQVLQGTAARALNPRQLSKVSDYVRSSLSNDLRVPELAALLGMEQRSFYRALRGATGLAPYAYLTTLRMDEAKKLLGMGKSVTETALLVGYTNPGKFSSAFQRLVGCSPNNWKKRKLPKRMPGQLK